MVNKKTKLKMNKAKDIHKGNKLIAEFMGAKEMPQDKKYNAHLYFEESFAPPINFVTEDRKWQRGNNEYRVALLDIENLQYHTSWDWLMPVVEKIESLNDLIVDKVWIIINGNSCGLWTYFDVKDVLRIGTENNSFKVKNVDKEGKLKATWRTVIDFITWYNQNKTS